MKGPDLRRASCAFAVAHADERKRMLLTELRFIIMPSSFDPLTLMRAVNARVHSPIRLFTLRENSQASGKALRFVKPLRVNNRRRRDEG